MVVVSTAANDVATLEYYARLAENIKRPYRNIKKKDANAIWELADAGELMCNQMLEKNEKNYLVPKIQSTLNAFLDVKLEIETRLKQTLPRLSDKTLELIKKDKEAAESEDV
jgi:hypothetical protein